MASFEGFVVLAPDRKWRRVFARCQLLISPMTRALVHGPPPSHGAFGALDAEQKMSAVGEKNVPSKYLSAEENANVFSALGADCASMASGMAQLMIAEGSRWSIVWIGVACYVRNYERKIVTIAIVDPGYERLRRPSIRCEIAIGVDVTFLALSNSFIAFEADSTKYALNFAVEEEAQSFLRIVSTLQMRRLRKKQGPTPTILAPIRDDDQLTTAAPSMVTDTKAKKKKKKEKTSFVEWLLSDGQTKKDKKKKKAIKAEDISTPMNQKHMMHYGADGSFLSKEGELDPTVNELYKHIHKDLDGDAADEMRNKKLLEAAVKHLGADEVRKIVEQKKVTPSAPKIVPPETPKPGAVTLQASVDTSRTSSTFSRGTRFSQGADFDSPGIPLIQARNSIRVSKENYYKRNTVNAVKKYQDASRSNGSTASSRASPTYEPPRSHSETPGPLPARKQSLLMRNPSQSGPPSGPPPPLPEVSMKPSEVAMDMRKRAPKADPTKKPVPKAGPTSPPPPLPSMKQEQPKKAKPPHIVAGPSSPPPPLPQATKEPSKKPVLKAGPSTPTVTPKEESKVAPVVGGPPAPPPLPPLAPPAPPLELPKTPTTPTASPSRANLLEEIRRGVPLSKVGATPEKESPEEETPPRSGNSIMDAISTKLNEMRDKIQPESDSEEEEDDSDDWDEC